MASDEPEVDDVRDRLTEIQKKHRGRIRWRITRHTAELTIRALEEGGGRKRPKSGKTRRRKRHKRLL